MKSINLSWHTLIWMTNIRNNRSCKISVFKNLDQFCFINIIVDTSIGLYEAMIFMIKNFLHMNSLCRDFNSPANIYLFKFNNENTRKRCEICWKSTRKHQNDVNDVVLVFLLLTLNIFHTFFYCFYCWLWTNKC